MAVLKEAPARPAARIPEAEASLLGRAPVLVVAALLLLLAFGWTFLRDPTISAPTRDPAWYTWRANVLMHASPGLIVQQWGPFSMFSGGYRVAVPLFGAILVRVAGIDLYTFSALMMVGIPVLMGLALGAFGYREHRDPLLFLLIMLATAALFMTTPYVGYLDNITVLYVLSLLLAFIGPARTSWGARSAVFMFGMLAAFIHPTTCVIFGLVLLASFGLHLLTSRFSIGKVVDRDAPMLMAAGLGMILGLSLWTWGIWGVKGSLADAALPPPYTREVFLERLGQWVTSMTPLFTFPLIGLAIGWTIHRARRDRRPADSYGTISTLWLLPLLGALGWLAGRAYPYYRFMNATAAAMALLGLGAWVAVRWLLQRQGAMRPAAALAVVLLLASLGYVWVSGRSASRWADPNNQWIDPSTRVALAAASAVVEREPGHPIVFVLNFRDSYQAYGWSKTFTNVSRTGLPGAAVHRSASFFGDVRDLLANRPTELTDPTYNKMSRGFFEQMRQVLAEHPEPPIVFLLRQFNGSTSNTTLLDQTASPNLVKLGKDVAVVTGSGLATPSPETVAAARATEERIASGYADHPGIFGSPLHSLRILVALGALLVLPGLIASRWFELEGFWTRFALIPGVSVALVVLSGIAVVAVTRRPFGVGEGWASVALAVLVAVGLAGLGRRRKVGNARVGPALNRFANQALALFSNRNFSFLMSAQFLAVAGDGVVQGSLAKAIAFGGRQGFSLEGASSARYVLALVVLTYLPYTFVSPLVGVLIDRFDRRKLLVWSNALRAALVALLAVWGLAAGFDHIPDVALIVALLLTLACTRMLLAIKSAGLPEVLEGHELLQGNSISQAGSAVFQLLGAAVAVVGTKLLPVAIPVLAGAGVYAAGSIVATRIEHLASERRKVRVLEEVRRVNRDVVDGFREVRRRPAASLGLFSFQAIRMELVSFVGLVFALEARTILGTVNSSKTAVYIAGGTAALGAALGFVVAQRFKDRVPPSRMLLAAMAVGGTGVIAFGGVTTILGFSALTFVAALGFFVGKVSADTIMQRALPDDFRGRGFSLFDIAYNLGWIVPALILFLVWSESHVRLILIASGLAFLAVTALVWRWAGRINEQLAAQSEAEEYGSSGAG